MKIGIIGGNSQVATETALYLSQSGHSVIPIVRNELGAAHLAHLDFSYRIEDVSKPNCSKIFDDLDVIVIAAHAEPYYRGYTTTSEAHGTNVDIIKNSVEFTSKETTIIYFSSIAAYGNEYSQSYRYIKEKRKMETKLQELLDEKDRDWYALRLGHVLGSNTGYYKNIRKCHDKNEIKVPTDGEKRSNVVHPKVISDVIVSCENKEMGPGIYGVVNNPQWTWKDVFDFVIPSTKIKFTNVSPSNKSLNSTSSLINRLKKNVLSVGWGLFGNSRDSRFSHIYTKIPNQAELKVHVIRQQYSWASEISSMSNKDRPTQFRLNIMNQPPLSDDLYPDIPKTNSNEIEKLDELEQIPL